MVAYAFVATRIAVDECDVRFPGMRRLVFEFIAVEIVRFNALLDLGIHSFLDFGRDFAHFRHELSDILSEVIHRAQEGMTRENVQLIDHRCRCNLFGAFLPLHNPLHKNMLCVDSEPRYQRA